MQYLLIFGTLRSGKTLVGRALNMHPNIIVQKEPFFFYFKICRNIFYRDILKKTDFDPNSPMDSDFCKPYEEKRLFKESFSNIYFGEEDIEELKKLTVKQQGAEPGERSPKILPFLNKLETGNAPFVFRRLMDILGEAYFKEGVKFIGVTEGWCDEFIEPMLNLPEINVKCIHCLRDPRAIIASRNAGDTLSSYGGKYPLLFLIRHWRKTIAYSIINEKNEKYMAVQYECLIHEPELWFKNICNFLDVPFSENLLMPYAFVRGDGKFWKQNTSYSTKERNAFSTFSIEKWKKVLSKQEISIIEYLCKAEMKFLRYNQLSTELTLRDILNYEEKDEEIIEWLRKYRWTFNEKELIQEVIRKYLIENIGKYETDGLVDFFWVNKIILGKLAS